MSKTDILEYMLPDQAWAMENHLETTTGSPIYTFYDAGTGELWNMKGSGGFPWDSWHVGEDYLYQRVTENDKAPWTAVGYASSFKLFCSKTWPNGKGGIAWCQRYFQEESGRPLRDRLRRDFRRPEGYRDALLVGQRLLDHGSKLLRVGIRKVPVGEVRSGEWRLHPAADFGV